MFETASRLKLRFPTFRGSVTVEDLWDMPLTDPSGHFSLDDVAKNLNRRLKNDIEESFVVKNPKNATLELQFNIVKHVIATKLAEEAANQKQATNKKRNEKILAIMERKQDAALENQDMESLKAMLEG
jgi:hypothetical protein